MSQIVNTLPAIPDDMPYDNYLLYHVNGTDYYRISNFDSLVSDTVTEDGECYYNKRVVYDYDRDSDSWVYYASYNSPYESHSAFYTVHTLIASSVDIHNPDGTLLCSATKKDYFSDTISLISTSITSSTFTSALNDIKFLMPMLVVSLAACIAFRKALDFLRGCVKGA